MHAWYKLLLWVSCCLQDKGHSLRGSAAQEGKCAEAAASARALALAVGLPHEEVALAEQQALARARMNMTPNYNASAVAGHRRSADVPSAYLSSETQMADGVEDALPGRIAW